MDFRYKSGPRFLLSAALFLLAGLVQLLTFSTDLQPFMQGLSLFTALGLFVLAGERGTRYWRSYVTIADGNISIDRAPLPPKTYAMEDIDCAMMEHNRIDLQLHDGRRRKLVHRSWLDPATFQALEEELDRHLPVEAEEDKMEA
ncbi:hypothetical protein [Alkalicoccus chagannorensis]|uniref:hypothetical protein n=1 Tax=Alkalicoccus chagannorensis TaxID=427072 RepID=UPI00047B9C02|nr:hypothetical protein [Alkalicoccus chagannorensis]